jgi:hypothetical protein
MTCDGITMLQGAVTVAAMVIPAVYSLIVLLRLENARGIETTKVAWVKGRVQEQAELLEGGQQLTMDLDALTVRSISLSPSFSA